MRWALLLTILGLAAAFVPVVVGWQDLPDAVPFILLVGGSVAGWLKFRGKLRLVGAIVLTLPPFAFAWWIFGLAVYPAPEGVPQAGAQSPQVSADRVRDGARFNLVAQRGHMTALVFFRASW